MMGGREDVPRDCHGSFPQLLVLPRLFMLRKEFGRRITLHYGGPDDPIGRLVFSLWSFGVAFVSSMPGRCDLGGSHIGVGPLGLYPDSLVEANIQVPSSIWRADRASHAFAPISSKVAAPQIWR